MRESRTFHFASSLLGLSVALAALSLHAQVSAPTQPPQPGQQTAPPAASTESAPAPETPAQPPQVSAAPQQPSFPASAIGVPMTPFSLPAAQASGSDVPAITDEQLRSQLEGKTFYLRGGYLENSLHFNANGSLDGNSPSASHTLSLVEIDRVHLEKHRLELEGVRYGLHFLGARPSEDQTQAVDKVRLTTKKKPLRITIDREQVEKPKKEKSSKSRKHGDAPAAAASTSAVPTAAPATAASVPPAAAPDSGQSSEQSAVPATAQALPEPAHGAVTTSQAHANRVLIDALDHVFAAGIDDRVIATLPDYWRLFYKSVTEHREYRPADPAVLRQAQVDQKAKLLSAFEPPSNEFAQSNGVAGMALYHVVIGADGKPTEIAVGRPIGFGLDENAVAAIRKASFQSAVKHGEPVPVVLDLLVQFRIFSKRTGVTTTNAPALSSARPAAPVVPGPYTANQPRSAAQAQPAPPPQ